MRIIRDDIPGFTPPGDALRKNWRRRSTIAVELLTSFALIGAIGIAAFAVSMEIAEAGALRSVHPSAHGVAISALLLLLLGTGGLTAFATIAPVIRSKPARKARLRAPRQGVKACYAGSEHALFPFGGLHVLRQGFAAGSTDASKRPLTACSDPTWLRPLGR